ncbi:MAG: lytic transglycosylase domain-containing protein, partial [Marmoricola sp.]|nr:lytic transglycosylase domain-containing protein [Marmoricola sp.]
MLRLRRLIVPLLAIVTTAATAPAFAAEGPAQVSDPGNTTTATAQTSGDFGYVWSLATGQVVMPGAYLQALSVTHPGSTGTRSDEQFFQISSTGSNDVPSAALRAYKHAADVMAHDDPGCQIPWTLLAAIGRVESNHGRFGGAQLGSDGESRPAILGPVLDGTGAFAAIKDTDHGTMDGNKVWDRAVGQMQFLPSTWLSVARDGDGNGTKDPNNINDAALGAAVYLCGVGGSLANPTGMARAAFRYNHSDYYVQLVLSFQNGYDTGVFSVPSPPPPPTKTVKA